MTLYRNKYREESIRSRNWDYGSPRYYFVTVCTKDREHFFGEVARETSRPITEDRCLMPEPWAAPCGGVEGTHNNASLPPATHTPHVSGARSIEINATLDEFIVMPHHIHGILCFQKPGYRERNKNAFGPQSQNLGSVIRNYKGVTKAYATAHGFPLVWQARYHDDVITSGKNWIASGDTFATILKDGSKRIKTFYEPTRCP